MDRLVLTSKVDGDGALRLNLHLGMAQANLEFRVTVEPVAARKAMSATEWEAWVEGMAGSLQGDGFLNSGKDDHDLSQRG
ncbi:MAG: hypothetical protein U0996_06885 [Planctomycetaceae bacterium]